MRALGASAGLGLRRAWGAPGRWAAVALAVGLAVAVVGGLRASATVAGDHAAHRVLAATPVARQAVTLNWIGGALTPIDSAARNALAAMRAAPVTRGVLLQPTAFGRSILRLTAIGPIAPSVSLIRGRLPRGRCRPARCEVLQVSGPRPAAALTARGITFAVVGQATIANGNAIGLTTRRADLDGPSTARRPTMLAAGDPAGLDALTGIETVSRTQTWSAGIALSPLHAWEIPEVVGRIATAHLRLNQRALGFTATTPEDRLALAQRRSGLAPSRLAAAGATGLAALAVFLILAAGALRAGLAAEDRRLARSGATAGQRAALALGETALAVAAGAVAGAGVAFAFAALRAGAGGVPAGHVLADLARHGLGGMLLVAAAAWLLALVAGRAPGSWVPPLLGGAMLAATAALAGLLLPRSGAGQDPLPGAVIPLAAVAGGLLAGLVVPMVLRLLARGGLVKRPLARMALLEMARDAAPPSLAVAGLVVGVGLGGFAAAYRSTLDRSQSDQAAYRVPLSATVLPGAELEPPLRRRTLTDWARLDDVAAAVPVIRTDASALAGPTRDPVALLGVPAPTLGSLRAWRPQDAIGTRAALAARLTPAGWAHPFAGVRIPADAATLSVAATATGDRAAITAFVRDRDGGALQRIALGTAAAAERTLRIALPRRARGGTLEALGLNAEQGLRATAGHQAAEGGGGGAAVAQGFLTLRDLRLGGERASLAGWRGQGSASGSADHVRYAVAGGEPAILHPPQPFRGQALPVLADPDTAADAAISHGIVLDVTGVEVRARVVGVARRMPTIARDRAFVVADERALSAALDARLPSSGEPRELWLAGRTSPTTISPAAAGAVRRLGLRARTGAATRRGIAAEPISREVLGALTATAVLAALLALASVAVAMRSMLREGRAGLLDLETQGVGPARLRAGLRLRGCVIVLIGVVPGLLLALLLTRLVTDAIRSGAGGAIPHPELIAVVPWATGVAAGTVMAVLAIALAALVVAPSLREETPPAAVSAEAT